MLENPTHFLLHCLIITVSYALHYDFHQPELKQGTFSTLGLEVSQIPLLLAVYTRVAMCSSEMSILFL